jgi:hypothetical protein
MSAPFLRDTGVIIDQFVVAVRDLFSHAYTDKDLYGKVKAMPEEELFADLKDYLEEVKFGIYEALGKNLDKLSLKFLQTCKNKSEFDGYLKSLKDRWKNSSSTNSTQRFENKSLYDAKKLIDRIAAAENARSKSPSQLARNKIGAQVSDFNSANSPHKSPRGKPMQGLSVSTIQDMPLNDSKMNTGTLGTRISARPALQTLQETPRKSSPRRRTPSPSPVKKTSSPLKNGTKKSADNAGADHPQPIVTVANEKAYNLEQIDPLISRRICFT